MGGLDHAGTLKFTVGPFDPRAAEAHERFLFTGERTCIQCHRGIAHRLPDMRGVPGWQ